MNIRLHPGQQKIVEELADKSGRSPEEVVRGLLDEALSRRRDGDGVGPPGEEEEVARRQHAAIDALLARPSKLPHEPEPDDGLSGGRDHDRILYGNRE